MAYFKYQGKSIYYEEYGQGEPLIFLHGNTASSKMSELLMPVVRFSVIWDGTKEKTEFEEVHNNEENDCILRIRL